MPGFIVYIFAWLWHMVGISYMGSSFVLLSYSKFNLVYSAFGHYLQYFLPFGIVAAVLLPKRDSRKDAAAHGVKKQTKVE